LAVLITKRATLDGKEICVKAFLPPGKVSKTGREKAERLDSFLSRRMREIEKEMMLEGSLNEQALKKWHALGARLQFVDDAELVEPSDVNERFIWQAVREHCPSALLPKGELEGDAGETKGLKRAGKKNDHFELCYRLGKYKWSDVDWLPSWTEWVDLIEAPGLIGDQRIVCRIAELARTVYRSLVRENFREVVKELRKEFPTKSRPIESSELNDSEIREKVNSAFRRVWDKTQGTE